MNLFNKIYSIIKRNLKIHNFIFLFFCLKRNKIKKVENNNIVLVEFNQFSGCMISYFYFMNAFFKSEKVNFYLLDINLKKKINDFFFYLFFYFIGVRKELNFNKIKKLNHLDDYNKFKNKIDVINYTKNNVNIGIDIYEGFLRTYNQPTIDLKDIRFKNFFLEYLAYFEDMLVYVETNKNNLKALIIFQSLYKNNMLCKLAYKYKIPVYLPDLEKFHKNEKAYNEVEKFKNYKVQSMTINDLDKKIENVKKMYIERSKGIQPAELSYSTALLNDAQQKYEHVFQTNKNIRVLVCSHCFYDNPHPYEKSSFPDYYEWLKFICKLSNKTNYSWRIKVHNDCLPGTIETIERIIKDNKSDIKLLPKDITHTEIIKSKVTHVLTCHGTVGFEYSYFNVPVINFNYNPRISFNYNLHAYNNIKKYEDILLNLENSKYQKIDLNELYTSYFMHYYHNASELFVDNYYETLTKSTNNKKDYFFRDFLSQWNIKKENNINIQIEKFIKSKQSYFCWKK